MSCRSLLQHCAWICNDCQSATSSALASCGHDAAGCRQLAFDVALRLVVCTSDFLRLRHPSKRVWPLLREKTACDYRRYTSDLVFDPAPEVLAPDDRQNKYMYVGHALCRVLVVCVFFCNTRSCLALDPVVGG